MKDAEIKLQKNAYWAGHVAIQRTIVQAWVEYASGKQESALATMQQALSLENATEKSAISPGPFAPAGEQLGELLLELKRPREALAAYQAALEKDADRFRGIYGAAIAAEASGDALLANKYFSKLVSICEKADAERPELTQARAFLAANTQ